MRHGHSPRLQEGTRWASCTLVYLFLARPSPTSTCTFTPGGGGTVAILQESGERVLSPNYILIRLATNACVFNPVLFSRISCNEFLTFSGVLLGNWSWVVVSCSVGFSFSALGSPLDQTSFKTLLALLALLFSLSLWFHRGEFSSLYIQVIPRGSEEISLNQWPFSFQLHKTITVTKWLYL